MRIKIKYQSGKTTEIRPTWPQANEEVHFPIPPSGEPGNFLDSVVVTTFESRDSKASEFPVTVSPVCRDSFVDQPKSTTVTFKKGPASCEHRTPVSPDEAFFIREDGRHAILFSVKTHEKRIVISNFGTLPQPAEPANRHTDAPAEPANRRTEGSRSETPAETQTA